jgi:hypothetical protein
MNRRVVIAAVGASALAGAVVPCFAQTVPPTPVGAQVDTTNGVAVTTTVFGQPGAGAWLTSGGQLCAGFGEQVPQCVDTGIALQPLRRQNHQNRQNLPVVVQHDDTGTTVIVGSAGLHVSPDGQVCPLVSTQDWQCVGGS